MSLLRWQFASLISKFIAVGIGIAQGIIVVRILSPSEYGLVGIVAAVGGVVGVYQHLGLASGTIREISSVKTKKDAFKVFLTSVTARFSISLPLALGLFVFSRYIAENIYHQSQITVPLRLYALILLLQAGQDVSNSVLAGLQKFKRMFIFQAGIAVVSFLTFVPLVYYYKFNGYFIAMLFVTLVSAIIIWILALKSFEGQFAKPSISEVKKILKNVFSVGIAVYFAKIAFTFWQRIGPLFLGTIISTSEVGFFNFATFYANKILSVSDALTDVNLPTMTKKFTEGVVSFRKEFLSNFEKVYTFMVFGSIVGIYWAPELIRLAIGNKYDPSIRLIPVLVLAFLSYGLINLLSASIIVPARLLKQLVFYYGILIIGTLATYFLGTLNFYYDKLGIMAIAMLSGSLLSLIYLGFVSFRKVKLLLVNTKLFLVTLMALPFVGVYFLTTEFITKLIFFVSFGLVVALVLDRIGVVKVNYYAKKLKVTK